MCIRDRAFDDALQWMGVQEIRLLDQRLQAAAEVHVEIIDPGHQQPVHRPPEHPARAQAGLHDSHLRFSQHQQQAMGLDRTGEVDQFTLAVRHVGLAEGRAGRHAGPN